MKKGVWTVLAVVSMSSCAVKTYDIAAKSGTTTSGEVKFFTSKKNTENETVTMKIIAKNLTPGSHAVHIHEKGDCSAKDASSAGSHWNPTQENHGAWGNHHFHRGDIGNMVANDKGEATLTFQTDKWCLSCEDTTKNIVGKSIIIHEKADDFQTQPTGNAGGRVACIEIK